jgi:hypothetical protein
MSSEISFNSNNVFYETNIKMSIMDHTTSCLAMVRKKYFCPNWVDCKSNCPKLENKEPHARMNLFHIDQNEEKEHRHEAN